MTRTDRILAAAHLKAYELSCDALLILHRVPTLSSALSRLAKIWLRQARLLRHLGRGGYDAIIDGGASIGEFAALARLACPRTPLLCVEPHPGAAARLRRRGFSVIEAALWNEATRVTLTQLTHAPTSSSLMPAGGAGLASWTVAAVRLDQLAVPGARLLIKLDLQGAERHALEGMGELWARCAGLLLEVSYGAGGTYEPLRTLLAGQGFFEAATFNELESDAGPVEADKLWLRRR